MCPSFRGLPSQAFEYILYNKGIMGEDSYPYIGKVTVGGLSCVSPFHPFPPPLCYHSNWKPLGSLLVPSALTRHLLSLLPLEHQFSVMNAFLQDPPTSIHIAKCLCDSTGPPCVHLHPDFGLFRKHLSDQLDQNTYLGQRTLEAPGMCFTLQGHVFPVIIPINSRLPQTTSLPPGFWLVT